MKKWRIVFVFLVFIFPLAAFSQEQIKLTSINKPGDTGIAERTGIVLAENILGPYKLVFSGNSPGSSIPVLSREERDPSKSGKGSFDKLAVLYSGRIYSPTNMAGLIMFGNKTAEELVLLEIPVFPTILEQPYSLYMDLKIQAVSKPIGDKISDDAGEYLAVLNVSLIKL